MMMPDPDRDDAQVTYTVRELLDRIRTEQTDGFARIETKMAGKADKADLERIEARLDAHERALHGLGGRVDGVEVWQHDKDEAASVHQQRDQRFTKRTKAIWVAVTTLLLILATAFAPAIAAALT